MAGYVVSSETHSEIPFNLGDPNIVSTIVTRSDDRRVITLQLDGDELAAALWGLKEYRKPLFDWENNHA